MCMCKPFVLNLLLFVSAHNEGFSLSLIRGRLDVIRYLVESQHYDVNVTDKKGRTCLHLSCQ